MQVDSKGENSETIFFKSCCCSLFASAVGLYFFFIFG